MMEIGQIYIDPVGKIHNIDDEEFRKTIDSLIATHLSYLPYLKVGPKNGIPKKLLL